MALRCGGYYIKITEVVGGFVTVQNCSAEIAFFETVHVHFHLQLEDIFFWFTFSKRVLCWEML